MISFKCDVCGNELDSEIPFSTHTVKEDNEGILLVTMRFECWGRAIHFCDECELGVLKKWLA